MRQPIRITGAPLRFTLGIGLLIVTLLFLTGCASTASRQRVGVVVEYRSADFEFLAGYGEWVSFGSYGPVWRPYVISSWYPFYYGHWVWTGYDWAWVSYEPYGWLVYHYGYWDYAPGIGWFWIPGEVWSPARVEWVVYGEYIGWTALPPPGVNRPRVWETSRVKVWNVVKIQNFTQENVGRYKVKPRFKKGPQFEKSVSHQSPQPKFVENFTRQSVPVIKIERQTEKMPEEQKYQKIALPGSEAKKVDKYQPQVEREALRSQKSKTLKDKDSEKKKGEPQLKKKKQKDKEAPGEK